MPPAYELAYVEVVQRHHKRTPYASNAFPVEPYRWDCDDQALYAFGRSGAPSSAGRNTSAQTYRQGTTSPLNPFIPDGWIGSCVFPQITSDGLDDSWAHGADLYAVYHDVSSSPPLSLFAPFGLDSHPSPAATPLFLSVSQAPGGF